MIAEMIAELDAAGNRLNTAIKRYLIACLTIQNYLQKANAGTQELSIRAASELPSFASRESKIHRARQATGWIRNQSPTNVPINSLPPEILSRIFHLVLQLGHHPCTNAFNRRHLPDQDTCLISKYPDLLTHVCSRWRQVAIGDSTLWSHIDITPVLSLGSTGQKLIDRAKVYAARAGQLLLNIDIIERTGTGRLDDGPSSDEMGTSGATNDSEGYWSYDLEGHLKLPRTSPYDLLEKLLYPLTILRLGGWHIDWNSSVYHGLTELHLISVGTDSVHRIWKSELVGILRSSPALRVFRFDLEIINEKSSTDHVGPVRLDNLEVLSLVSINRPRGELGTLLGLFTPGSKPLQLSIDHRLINASSSLPTSFKQFLARSNVTKIQLRAGAGDSLMALPPKLLSLSPIIQELAFTYFSYDGSTPNSQPLRHHLDALYMMRCRIPPKNAILQLIKENSFQKVVFYDCKFVGREHLPHFELKKDIQKLLSEFCPVVQVLSGDDPSPDWDPSALEDPKRYR
ncbi:F-box-like domain containing protein [Ceratobasidium theobromae]|uniref:F-box-like domain containing protein n=1 Tax=Ceratobasidium theobromae TaxID=1582974 RepID=A0A5N5QF17_9AGAM|nr:F-box-like domain containing protein [Ceratobasidium theobromae]